LRRPVDQDETGRRYRCVKKPHRRSGTLRVSASDNALGGAPASGRTTEAPGGKTLLRLSVPRRQQLESAASRAGSDL